MPRLIGDSYGSPPRQSLTLVRPLRFYWAPQDAPRLPAKLPAMLLRLGLKYGGYCPLSSSAYSTSRCNLLRSSIMTVSFSTVTP